METHGIGNSSVLLEKVFDAGANTIWSEMKKLRGQPDEKKEHMRKRWVWELIQNASDCTPQDGSINIEINYRDDGVLEFSHDGEAFSYENIVDLVTQISSKQSDGEKTGKFGTGFISTHLLSELVEVSGVLRKDGINQKRVDFEIDRSGESYHEVRGKIKEALKHLDMISSSETAISEILDNRTRFVYNSCDSHEKVEAINVGLEDLKNTVPFVLALNPTINSITCNGVCYSILSCEDKECGSYYLCKVTNPLGEPVNVIFMNEDNVSISIVVDEITENVYKVLSLGASFPKLFCRFPLIGTENFSFPVVINSPMFDVEKDRNAIHEGSDENIQVIKTAIKLYFKLLDYAKKNDWQGMYNLCNMNRPTSSSLQKKIIEVVRQKVDHLPIVDVNRNSNYIGRIQIKSNGTDTSKSQIYIPYCKSEEFSDRFWQLSNFLVDYYIPTLDTYMEWLSIIDQKIDIYDINGMLEGKTIEDIDEIICIGNVNLHAWLNQYYTLWIESEGKEDFIEKAYVLNQDSKFVRASLLWIDDNIPDVLKKILNELGENIKSKLLCSNINLPAEVVIRSRDSRYIAEKIENEVNKILSEETINNTKRVQTTQATFSKLTVWFMENPETCETLFESLYSKRSLLSPPDEQIRRLKIAEKVESHNVGYDELDAILESHAQISEIIDDLDDLSKEEIKLKLKHISKNNIYARHKYEELLERATESVYNYLSDLDDYEIASSLEEWIEDNYFSTVYKAKKNEKDIRIVIRPSDDNKIIFYHDEEVEALDDTDYELWTNDGVSTRIITLGDIIKTTGITAIPLKNIYNN